MILYFKTIGTCSEDLRVTLAYNASHGRCKIMVALEGELYKKWNWSNRRSPVWVSNKKPNVWCWLFWTKSHMIKQQETWRYLWELYHTHKKKRVEELDITQKIWLSSRRPEFDSWKWNFIFLFRLFYSFIFCHQLYLYFT